MEKRRNSEDLVPKEKEFETCIWNKGSGKKTRFFQNFEETKIKLRFELMKFFPSVPARTCLRANHLLRFILVFRCTHFGRQVVCCVPIAHGKAHFTHGKGFVVCNYKVLNYKVLNLKELYNFDIKIIYIRGRHMKIFQISN